MEPHWVSLGLQWVAAFDEIKLTSIMQALRDLDFAEEKAIGAHLTAAIRNRLTRILGPAALPKPAKKRRFGRWLRPPDLSQEAWESIVARRKARRNQLERANYAKRRQRQKSDQPAALAA